MYFLLSLLPAFAALSAACKDCYGPKNDAAHVRHVRRMQPGAEPASTGPRAPLAWGQLNFLHTTDTHGWLEGHIKEQNYGADWGDFTSFTIAMKQKAADLGVDLLLIDTGDLHDGNGLSDATTPNGALTNPIFEKVDYDLLTIGNHELYVTEVAYETSNQFAKVYGDRYVTSNVKILNPKTGQFEYIGVPYRYFTTAQGLRIMSFGVLFDFTGNSNVSQVIKAQDLVKEQWFLDAINYPQEIDLFLVIGHNPPRPTEPSSTFGLLHKTIRGLRPDVPVQVFGGHTHVRDFVVYDEMATGMESGRYCETLGFLSMSGIRSSTFKGNMTLKGVPNPTQRAIKVPRASSHPSNSSTSSNTILILHPKSTAPAHAASNATIPSANNSTNSTNSFIPPPTLFYSRRYLDWNLLTFTYHLAPPLSPTTPLGTSLTHLINTTRASLNLTTTYGCSPHHYCQNCLPYPSPLNLQSLLTTALAATVISPTRSATPRLILLNTGAVRFDLLQGKFTVDDADIVCPFADEFNYIPDVPYGVAAKVLDILNKGPFLKRSEDQYVADFPSVPQRDACVQHSPLQPQQYSNNSSSSSKDDNTSRHHRRDTPLARRLLPPVRVTPGYTTTDDFGTMGDDTPHAPIPFFAQPNVIQANASLPTDGKGVERVDLVFVDFIGASVISALRGVDAEGGWDVGRIKNYGGGMVVRDVLPAFARKEWSCT